MSTEALPKKNKKQCPLNQECIEAYISSTKSMEQVAKQFGIKCWILKYWIKKLGYKIRPAQESRKANEVVINKAIDTYFSTKRSLDDIAEEVGISATVISRSIKKKGLNTRSSCEASKTDESIVNSAVSAYKNSKESLIEIGKRFNVTGGAVRKWVIKAGVALRSKYDWKYDQKKVDAAAIDYINGCRTKQLAIKYNVDRRTIMDWLILKGIRPLKYNETLGITAEIKEKALRMYIEDELSTIQIANKLGISPSAICEWVIKSLGNKRRSRSEALAMRASKGLIKKSYGKKGNVSTRFGLIFFDSSYEEDRINQLNENQSVVMLRRCKDRIKYVKGDKIAHYNPDLYVEYSNGVKIVEEMKPIKYIESDINLLKIAAAKQHYLNVGVIYNVITEREIYGSLNKKYYKNKNAALKILS